MIPTDVEKKGRSFQVAQPEPGEAAGPVARVRQQFSLQAWLMFALGGFLLLVIVSVCLTFWGLDTQKQDALVINLAGRQRMLLQLIKATTLESQQEPEGHHLADLTSTADQFEQILTALNQGGEIISPLNQTVSLPAADDVQVLVELRALTGEWQKLRPSIDRLASSDTNLGDPQSAQTIINSIPQLISQADRVMQSYERASTAKIARMRSIQLGFLVSGLVLLILVSYSTRRYVIQPLDQLDSSAQHIGEGDLRDPVIISGPAEIQILGRTMETMRVQLRESQEALSQSIDKLELRVQQRTRELEALAAVEREIASHLSLDEVLKSVTEKASQLLDSEVAFLCLLDHERQNLNLQSVVGPESAVLQTSSSIANSSTGAFLHGETALPCSIHSCPGFCTILNPAYRTSHLAAPMRIGNHVIGALCVGGAKPGIFRPEASQVLAHLASIAAVALENSRLYQQAEQMAALEERQRIASDMHDGLLQTLSFLRWMVRMSAEQLARGDASKALTTFQQVERAEEQAESEIRRAIASLQEDFPIPYTLQEQLSELVKERSAIGPAVEWECCVNLPVIIPRQESEQILRVAREALLNAQNHSQASRICLRFERSKGVSPGDEYQLSVIDDGIGFSCGPGVSDPDPGDGQSHFGLKIMRARAARIKGRIIIESKPGQGTCLELIWHAAPGTNNQGESNP